MMNWLLPRLERFKRDHPAVELRLNVNYGEVDFIRDEISIAIRNDMYQPPPTAIARPLIRQEIGPVCHPDYAERLALTKPADLAQARLLSTETRPQAWVEWAQAVGAPVLRLAPDERYEHSYLVIQAAACGLGVALAPYLLVEREIAAGHLVAPFGFTAGPHALVLWIAQRLRAVSTCSSSPHGCTPRCLRSRSQRMGKGAADNASGRTLCVCVSAWPDRMVAITLKSYGLAWVGLAIEQGRGGRHEAFQPLYARPPDVPVSQ